MDYLRLIYDQNKKIIALMEQKKKQWVKVGVITKMTGWTREQLRAARENGSVEYKRDKKGIWYNADSISTIHTQLKSTP